MTKKGFSFKEAAGLGLLNSKAFILAEKSALPQ